MRHYDARVATSTSKHQRLSLTSPTGARAAPSMHRSRLQDVGDAWEAALAKAPLAPSGHGDASCQGSPELPLAAPHMHCSTEDQLEWARALDRTAAPAAGAHPPHLRDPPASLTPVPGPLAADLIAVVIECGSHSTRALVCDQGGKELARMCVDTHMAAGLVPGEPLEPGAVQRCTAALEAVHAEVQQLSRGGLAGSCAAATLGDQGRQCRASGALLQAGDRQEAAAKVVAAAVGTMALRQCGSFEALSQHVRRLFEVQLRVLSGEEEGQLAYHGACLGHQAAPSSPTAPAAARTKVGRSAGANADDNGQRPGCVVVDMGGMSTELTWMQEGPGLQVLSLPLGCVALTASFFTTCSSNPGAVASCRRHVREVLDREGGARLAALRAQLAEQGQGSGVRGAAGAEGAPMEAALVGGTATTAAALLLSLPAYDSAAVSSCRLSRAQLLDLAHSLTGARQGHEESACQGAEGSTSGGSGLEAAAAAQAELVGRYPWLSAARARTLAAGACGLAAVLEWLGVDAARVSDADLLDGAMAEVLEHCRLAGDGVTDAALPAVPL